MVGNGPKPVRSLQARRMWHGDLASILRGNVGIAVLGLAAGLVLARALEPEGRGLFAIALVWPSIAVTLIGLPGNAAVAFFAARNPDRRGDVVRVALWMSMLSSVAILLVGFAGSMLVHEQQRFFHALLIAFASTPFMLITGIGRGLLKAQSRDLKRWSRQRLVQPAAYIACVLLLAVADHLTLITAAAAFLISQVASASWVWVTALHGPLAQAGGPAGPLRRDVLVYGLKSNLAGSAQITNGRLDVALIGLVVSASQVGLYAVATSLAQYIVPLATAAAPWVFPRLAKSVPTVESWNQAQRAIRISMLLASVGAFLLGAMAPLLLGRVLGPEWLDALVPLWILLVGVIVQAVRHTLISVASAYNRPGLTAQSEGLAAVVTLAALWPMVNLLGINGAAIVSVLAYSTSALLLYRGVGRTLRSSRERLGDYAPDMSRGAGG